jgi:hypothetical protein
MSLCHQTRAFRVLGLSLLLSLSICHAAELAQTSNSIAGIVALVQGLADVTSDDGVRRSLSVGSPIRSGDTIATGVGGEVHAKLEDGGYLAIRPNTTMVVERFSARGDDSDTSVFRLVRGALRSVTGWVGKFHPQAYRITTPTATVGIRGTDHELMFLSVEDAKTGETPGTHDEVNHGATYMENSKGTVEIVEGHAGFASIAADKPPALHTSIPAFITNRRTLNDGLVDKHYAEIDKHIEGKLREHGVLHDNEKYADYFANHAANKGTPSKAAEVLEHKKNTHRRIGKP